MRATLSLLGLYEFDDTVLDGMNYPDKFTDDDKTTFIENLLMETAELEILYPDVKFMMTAIRAWSRKEKPVWDKLYETTILEYNPIWNKDGTVTETETIGREGTESSTENTTGSGSESTSNKVDTTGTMDNTGSRATKSETATTTKVIDESNHYVYGFNSDSASQDEKSDGESNTTGSGTATGTETSGDHETRTGSETGSGSKTSSSTNDIKRAGEHEETTQRTNTRIEKGNIGVTTTQSMIVEEREVDLFNLIDVMIESFKKRFCIMIY